MVTKEQVDAVVAGSRRRDRLGSLVDGAIVTLAGERDRLAAQVAELVALLRDAHAANRTDCEGVSECLSAKDSPARTRPGEMCWEHRRRELVARIKEGA